MKFDHLLVDWAWAYNNRLTGAGRTRFGSGATAKYKKVEKATAASDFDIPGLAADKCMMHFWTTGPFLEDAFKIIRAYGFTYTTMEFVWVKTVQTKPLLRLAQQVRSYGLIKFMQMYTRRMPGHYTASNTEYVLLAWKGGPLMPEISMQPQVIYAPPMEHSRKPDDVHEYIETAYQGQRFIELFARRSRSGWVTLGNEIDGRDMRESIPATIRS